MYYLIVWDKALAADGQDGLLFKLEVPMELAEFLFNLNPGMFPILSGLSFDDYNLFSGSQIKSLAYELLEAIKFMPSAAKQIGVMVKIVLEAESLGKSILFDPFRDT